MHAKKCDRCGKLYEWYRTKRNILTGPAEGINGIVTANIVKSGRRYEHRALDLCPECMEQFLKFWKMEDGQGWIPVSERLPEESQSGASAMVAVTFKDLGTEEVFVSEDFTINGWWVNHNRANDKKVIAWMKLEPYKEGE